MMLNLALLILVVRILMLLQESLYRLNVILSYFLYYGYKYRLSMINIEGGVERTGRKEGRKEGTKENLQTDEILCPLRLYKFPESKETFGFPLLAQLN